MGFFDRLNRIWSGADFWDKQENAQQRASFARQDEEEERKRRQQQQPTVRPGTVITPTQTQVEFDPSKPLERFNPIANTGFNNPILEMAKNQPELSPVEKANQEFIRKTRELDDLTEKYRQEYLDQEKNRTSWFSRQFTDRNWDKRAEAAARRRATREFQDKYGWNADPTVLAYNGVTSANLERAAEGGTSKWVAPVLSIGRVGTGLVEGAAGLYDLVTPGKGQNRVTQAATKKAEEIDQLAEDMDVAGLYRGLNVPLEIATYFTPTVVSKGGKVGQLTSKLTNKIDDLLKLGTKSTKTRRFISEAADEFLDPRNLEMEANITGRYLGQDSAKGEDIGADDLFEEGSLGVAGAFLPPGVRRLVQRFRGGEAAEDAAIAGTGAVTNRVLDRVEDAAGTASKDLENVVEEVESGVKQTASSGTNEADDLPGTRRVDTAEGTPSIQVEDGIKSTNAAKIPDPTSPVALSRPTEFDAPIANFDDTPPAPNQLTRADDAPLAQADDQMAQLEELSRQANDLDTPAFQRQGAKQALAELTAQMDEANARSLGVAEGPLDRPAFQHRNDLDEIIQQGNDELDNFLRDNPDASMADVEAAKAAIEDQVMRQIDELQRGRFGDDVDAYGNEVLKSDAQVARELAEEGGTLVRGDSVAGATEDAMLQAARQAEADEVIENTDVRQLLQAVEDAQAAYDDVAAARRGERGERIAAGGGAYQSAGGGESGYRAKLGQLKGKLSESNFNPANIEVDVQNRLLDQVENSNLRDFEKLTAQRGLRKIWGADSKKPVPSELQIIRKVFGKEGDELVDAVERAIEEAPKTWREKLVDIAGIPRTAMTAFDLSMGLRQGSGVMFTNFPQWAKANKESVKYAINGKYFDEAMKAIKEDDAYTMITDKMGVRLPGAVGEGDELMSSKDVLEKVWGYGKGIEASNRAYTGGLTNLRYNVAKQYIDSLGGIDAAAKLSDEELKNLGEVVNTFTGSGGKAGGITDRHITTLSSTLFAPRLWASRLNMLNPRFYQRLSGPARKKALANMASFMGAATATVGLMEYAFGDKMDVELDPRSSDFLKMKFGNTRFDIFSGLQQNIVLAARLATGQKKSSTTGEMVTLGEGFGDPSRFDVGVDALQNKFNPVLGLVSRYLQSGPDKDSDSPFIRKDKFGEEYNLGTEVAKMGAPLGLMGAKETYDDTGDLTKSVLMSLPGFFGVGVQTYGDIPTKEGDRFANAESLRDRKKQLTEAGIPITSEAISGLAKTGDYANAVTGAEYRLAELEADEKATEAQKANARQELEDYRFGNEYGYIPSSNEAIETRAENGDYDAAIAGWEYKLAREEAEGNTPKSKLESQRRTIKRYEVFRDNNTDPEMVMAYEKEKSELGGIGVTAWRDMMDSGDPELVAYAEELYNLDKALLDAGAIKEQKYHWGKDGRGGGKKGPRFLTNIGTLDAKGYSFDPLDLQKATFAPAQTDIPVLERVPAYSREKKQISVKRGRQV